MEPPLIAVVHDDRPTLELLDTLLTDAGYRTFLWSRGSNAHVSIRELQPDLVILEDMWLEHPTAGELVLGLLERDAGTQHIPVIICSAHTAVLHNRIQLFRQQGYLLLEKPFDANDLLNKVATLLGIAPTA